MLTEVYSLFTKTGKREKRHSLPTNNLLAVQNTGCQFMSTAVT